MKYSMNEVSKITKISPSAIRFYEEKGLLLPINRKPSGVRYFSEKDIERLIFITELKEAGLSIKNIYECFHFCDMGDDTIDKRICLFEQHKQTIQDKIHVLEHCMEQIDGKVAYLNEKKASKK
ncbi:MerR family transcriptional regulator [Clostridioides difficile]